MLSLRTEVTDGSTVTDFLPAERERGVTIQSAAITFHWPPLPEKSDVQPAAQKGSKPLLTPPSRHHTINLIDTPGHADFTFEVVRSLRILDGAVCILDGVAGVEAQTEKVWYQAAQYKISKLIYVNKLDRDGAEFARTVREVASRLSVWPAVCQIPWFEGGKGRFCGVGDVVHLRAYRWPEGADGKQVETVPIDDPRIADTPLVEEMKKARVALVELLTNHDEVLVEKFFEVGEHLDVPADDIIASLRRCVLNQETRVVPIYGGASFQNIGVQPLLDAIVQLLPNPKEVQDPEISLGRTVGTLTQLLGGNLQTQETQSAPHKGPRSKKMSNQRRSLAVIGNLEACALAFKVVHDSRRGALVYVRVYSGSIRRGASLYNTNLQVTEPAQRLLRMYASDSVDIPSLDAGQIGVIPGLKHARTGDTLISYIGANPKTGPPPPLNSLQLRPIEVPPAVFFSSIESNSLAEEKAVKSAISLLIREDPSLQLSEDEESGQILLSGMGEFHLEIAADRLIKDLKAKASVGKIEIAYREALLHPSQPETALFNREITGKKEKAGCTAAVSPLADSDVDEDSLGDFDSTISEHGNQITVSISGPKDPSRDMEAWHGKLPSHLSVQSIHVALRNGALAALGRGIQYSFPFTNVHVSIHIDPRTQIFGSDTSPPALSSAAREATKAALRNAAQGGSAIMEHVMNVTVSTDEASLGAVVTDLSSERGGHVLSLEDAAATPSDVSEDLPVIDLRKVYAPRDPFESGTGLADDQEQAMANNSNRQRTIQARVPLGEMIGYLKHLRSITGGRGSFVMSADRFERVVGQREKILQKELRGY
ncbi:MAG: hypothetical protein LQ352_003550 [Teloschistes flavicans]|nr:MAG: hypothetical protein LQ352_003550 [Teloschistes flavicans]